MMESAEGKKLMLCFQCASCTADCPVAAKVEEFRPMSIARLAIYGQKDRLLRGNTIWLCASCYTCYERCPQKVRVSEIISALRRIAFTEGLLHPTYLALMGSIADQGLIYEVGEFENDMRLDDGLPRVPQPAVEEIKAIMSRTGFARLLEGC